MSPHTLPQLLKATGSQKLGGNQPHSSRSSLPHSWDHPPWGSFCVRKEGPKLGLQDHGNHAAEVWARVRRSATASGAALLWLPCGRKDSCPGRAGHCQPQPLATSPVVLQRRSKAEKFARIQPGKQQSTDMVGLCTPTSPQGCNAATWAVPTGLPKNVSRHLTILSALLTQKIHVWEEKK